jgi:hypothetical protein
MDLLDQKTTDELLKSLLAETAKATNELRCAQADLLKAQNRLSFALAVTNALINRTKD